MTLTQKFSLAMYNARKAKGYTQSEVAEAVSITVRWYQKVESGERLPGTTTALRIIMFLDLNLEDFRTELELITPVSSNKRSLGLHLTR